MREYLAAKGWIESTESRQTEEQKQQRAREACNQLAQPI